ncbi:ferritin-like domain-containing protein [Actinoplanes solisilvae]|uniref:ferritin-like domain-containing protein n=1 Tax=Actinoplanes solisilvae TaxID=2486853 RepID=UPI000FDB4912|nr:DUF2202 domain-containing protein [Actinoplanes solisilvae]
MKATTRRRTITAFTVGALGLGGIAVAGPALAGGDMFVGSRMAAAQQGPGGGNGYGYDTPMGTRMRDGACLGAGVTTAQGTLTDQQKNTLVAMAQEEKLAHDLYAAFAARHPAPIFDRIATAETQHLSAIRTLLARYGVSDPTAGASAGTFDDSSAQATYDRLLARGTAGQAAAFQVGQEVERADIADLREALTGLTAADVTQVYQRLLTASRRHLTAFTAWAAR